MFKQRNKNDEAAHPLRAFHEDITDITSRFSFTHHPVPNSNGLIVAPQGFGRPFYHRPTNTIGVLFSKTADNLDGVTGVDGRIRLSQEQLERCYIFGARRAKGDIDQPLEDRTNAHTIRRELRDDMDKARREMGIKSRKHYTLYGGGDLYTNGRHAYEIVPKGRGGYKVVLRLSTKREDGSFIPIDLNDKSLRGIFSRANATIAHCSSRIEAREIIALHWKGLSAALWEQQSIFAYTSKTAQVKKFVNDFANVTMNKGPVIMGATTIVGGILGVKYGLSLGVMGGVTAGLASAFGHTAIQLPIEMGLEGYEEAKVRAKEVRQKLDIDAYDFDSDVSDHFKIQTPENIAKLCPHIDLKRFESKDFECLTLDDFDLRKDREQVQDNLQAVSLEGHLLFMGQRGFPSEACVVDTRTELRIFQTGIVRLMHEKPNGSIVVFGQYRPELCNNEALRTPQGYVDQFDGQIMRLAYDRTKPTFSEGLISEMRPVSYQDMLSELEQNVLFSRQDLVSWDTRLRSVDSIRNSFAETKIGLSHLRQDKKALQSSLLALKA